MKFFFGNGINSKLVDWLSIFVSFIVACSANAQMIQTRMLSTATPNKVTLNPNVATTLLFPDPVAGVFGLGLIQSDSQDNQMGSVQIDHPQGSPMIVLHALDNSAHVLMSVLLNQQLYVFDLQTGPNPDVAVTLTKADPGTPQPQKLMAEEVRAQRLKYDPELLVGFLRRAHDATLLRNLYPDLYEGYSSRPADYISDNNSVKTTVTQIHRFSKEDAVVLDGTVLNKTNHVIRFDARATTVQVANEVHPAKLTDVLQPIPAGATVPVAVVIQGGVDGARANLSLENEFRIMLPPVSGELPSLWDYKRGNYSGQFKIPRQSESKATISRTQTGKSIKDGP